MVLVISLHVDDTLAAGRPKELQWLHTELSKRLGDLKAEKNNFRHFGVDVSRETSILEVTFSQADYITNLKPIDRSKKKGITVDSPASAEQVSDFRSLVSGIAWVGITSLTAQAVASLLQGFLPTPTVGMLDKANSALAQVREEYVPHVFKHGFTWERSKLLMLADSALGNANKKKSQGGFIVFLSEDLPDKLRGHFTMVAFRSAQSKKGGELHTMRRSSGEASRN